MLNETISKKCQQGVTLLEMLITLAIAAILLTVVAPNVQSILTKNKITSEINELSGLFQFARFTAIDEQALTVVCPSSNFDSCTTNWNDPKMVFIDDNNNGARDAGEELLLVSQSISSTNTMTASEDIVQFLDSGGALTAANIKLCPNSKDAKFARALEITAQGRTRLSTDPENDGIHNDSSGNLSCS
uniref:GspH/FimT family pseudopilin n=1 Tax=Ningiella ruwaisensis TaxID=2364274 RepID=UPI00109F52F5|nr:GspH/FimT family pseudopilin [Ningiella ruwaisensis]